MTTGDEHARKIVPRRRPPVDRQGVALSTGGIDAQKSDEQDLDRGLATTKVFPELRPALIRHIVEIAKVDRFFAVELKKALYAAGVRPSGKPPAITANEAKEYLRNFRAHYGAKTDAEAAQMVAAMLIRSHRIGLERFAEGDEEELAAYLLKLKERKPRTPASVRKRSTKQRK